MNKAVFLDRDGIINELYYDKELGIIESPLVSQQVKLVFGITQLLQAMHKLGYLAIIVSNQPNIALKKTSQKNFDLVSQKIISLLEEEGALIDGQYYCFHHPYAKIRKYKKKCQCRKPGIDLFLKAAKDQQIDLKSSWVIGDGVDDIKAGKNAGCKTILLANINSTENLRIIEKQLGSIKPDFIIKKLTDAIKIFKKA